MRQTRYTPRSLAALMLCLFALGLWQVGEGSWIYAKASLAQLLLQRAWSRTLMGEMAVKPWPWADTWPTARLVVPSRNIDQIVLEGAYGRTLAFGPAHLESGGRLEDQGTIILTGHRDTHFRFLEKLQPGETIAIQTRTGTWRHFTVRDRLVVDFRSASIATDQDESTLALVTCYPFDAIMPGGPLRYVVIATTSSSDPNLNGSDPYAVNPQMFHGPLAPVVGFALFPGGYQGLPI